MPRTRNPYTEKHIRGVYEKVPGSSEWWVRWTDAEGKLRRQKIGKKSAAIAAYEKRKFEARRNEIVPDLRNGKRVTVGDLLDLAIEHAADHKDKRNHESRAAILKEHIGDRIATDLTPQQIDAWLKSRKVAPATQNRYKALLSLAYKLGIANRKVKDNPARSVSQRRENNARTRFLSRDEYKALYNVIQRRFPEHLAEFVVSVHTGMRLSEQYSCEWSQVDLNAGTIRLTDTKNGSARTVYLDADAKAAIESLKHDGQKSSDKVFPSAHKDYSTKDWFVPCLEDAGITEYVWHSNRHTFCSWLAMGGASVKDIQELAGHKTIIMAARYSHLSPDHKRMVIDRLSSSGE
jgi:integrase